MKEDGKHVINTSDQIILSSAADFNDAEADEPTDEEYKTLRKWVPSRTGRSGRADQIAEYPHR